MRAVATKAAFRPRLCSFGSGAIFVDRAGANLKAVGLPALDCFPRSRRTVEFQIPSSDGPNIAGALSGMTPIVAVLLAIVILGERIRGPQRVALGAIAVGISLMYRVHVTLTARSLWPMALPLAASAIRGVIQPIIKFGFEWWPNPIAAVVIS
jgi:hypothetical protein